MNPFIRLVAGMMAAVLVFLFPLQYLAQMQSEAVDNFVSSRVTEFTDTARNQGSITVDMYEDLVDDLDSTGDLYDISIQTSHPVTGKEMADNLHDNIGDYGTVNLTYTGKFTAGPLSNITLLSMDNPVISISSSDKTIIQGTPLGTLHVCDGINCTYNIKKVYVAVGYGIWYSTDKINWICAVGQNTTGYLCGVVYGNGRFVASGENYAYYSTDGINWTQTRSGLAYYETYRVTYGNGRFVCVSSNYSFCSTDGVTWTTMGGVSFYGLGIGNVTYGNGVFVATPSYGIKTYYSLDGLNWSNGWAISSSYENWQPSGILYGNNRFFIYGKVYTQSGQYNGLAYSLDGISWQYSLLNNQYFLAGCFSDGLFYNTDISNNLYTSADTVNWTYKGNVTTSSNRVTDITYDNGTLTAVGNNNGYAAVWTSNDNGSTWNIRDLSVYGATSLTKICSNASNYICTKKGKYCINVTATYSNSSTGTEEAAVSPFDYKTAGTYQVTLTYAGYIGYGMIGQRTCNINVTVLPNNKHCTAGLSHPDYDGSLTACPVCTALSKITTYDQTFLYDGNHHELNITNNSGCYIDVGYDIDPTEAGIVWQWNQGPSAPGIYPVIFAVYVYDSLTGTTPVYWAIQRYITIVDVKHCTAGLGHPDYDPSLAACPVCTAISKICVSDQSFLYDGNHHELNIVNNSGCYLDVGYGIGYTETDTIWQWNIGPTDPGTFRVVLVIYVYDSLTGTTPAYCIMERKITISDYVTSIIAEQPTQSLFYGGTMNSNAIITKASTGSTKYTVACDVTNFSNTTLGSQTVTLTYRGLGNSSWQFPTVTVAMNVMDCVTSIAAQTPNQTIYAGGTINSNAIITKASTESTQYTVSCSVQNFNNAITGTQTAVLVYYGMPNCLGQYPAVNTTVTVLSSTFDISITPSSTTVYNGTEPTYSVILTYGDNTTKTLSSAQYTKSGWTAGPGTKAVTFTYTEHAVTVTKTIMIKVLPNLTSISAAPASQSIQRYSAPVFIVNAYYEDGSSKIISSGYTVTGIHTNILGTQIANIIYSENNITKAATAKVIVKNLTVTCPICGTIYELDTNDFDQGCPVCAVKIVSLLVSPSSVSIFKGSSLPITVTAVFQSGKTIEIAGWTSDYNTNIIGIQEVKVSYQEAFAYLSVETLPAQITCPICGKPYSMNDNGADPGCPICSKQVISINVLEDNVTIGRYQPLTITVSASFRDGHTASITDWATDFIPDMTGTFLITIFYQSATDQVTVKVIDEEYTVCPYCGLEYDISDSPYGCPVCYKTIVGITAALRTGGTKVSYKSQLNLQINVTYRDTHKMVTYTGYTVLGYHPDQLGPQTVQVCYETFSTSLSFEVVDGPAEVICPYGHEYYLNEDGTDPGCPVCAGASNINEAIFYFEITYTSVILSLLYENGIYLLNKGDFLTVILTHRDVSLRTKLQKMFFGTNSGIMKRKYTFGGEVL